MQIIEQLDLSQLPNQAQVELYNYYMFLKEQYKKKDINSINTSTIDERKLGVIDRDNENWLRFIENNKKRKLYVDGSVDISVLIDDINTMKF